jgi:hypothetical protein
MWERIYKDVVRSLIRRAKKESKVSQGLSCARPMSSLENLQRRSIMDQETMFCRMCICVLCPFGDSAGMGLCCAMSYKGRWRGIWVLTGHSRPNSDVATDITLMRRRRIWVT